MFLSRRHADAVAMLLAVFLLLLFPSPSWAGKGDRAMAPSYGDMASSIALFLASPERLELPLERIRAALKAH